MILVFAILFFLCWALIIYSYVVFPVLLASIAGKVKSPLVDKEVSPYLPKVAMIVAAYNEESVLEAKLQNTWELNYPAELFEIVVGSDGSGDRTAEILNNCQDSRLKAFAFTERRGKISVLNDIVSKTDADILVMSDANTMFSPDAVRHLVAHFQDPKVGCVSGEMCLEQDGGPSGEGLYWKYEVWIKKNESRLGFLIGCNGGIFALPRALYEPLPASVIVEDFVLSMRILEQGYQVRFEPAARGTEPPCPTARAEMIRKIRIGAGSFQALRLTAPLLSPRFGLRSFAFWGHKVFRWFVPVFIVLSLIANVFLLSITFFQLTLAAQLLAIVVAVLAYRLNLGGIIGKFCRPLSYFYVMNYALLCGLFRFLFGTQKVTWDRASR